MDEKERMKPVIKGSVKTQDKTFVRKVDDFATPFMDNVIIPSLKSWLRDTLYGLIDSIFKSGNGGYSQGRYRSYYDDYPSYRSKTNTRYDYSNNYNEKPRAVKIPNDYTDIVLDSREDAENVLDLLRELIDKYGVASIMDLYDVCGLSCDFTYDKYGWHDLNHQIARVVRTSGGYTFRLPRAVPLEK